MDNLADNTVVGFCTPEGGQRAIALTFGQIAPGWNISIPITLTRFPDPGLPPPEGERLAMWPAAIDEMSSPGTRDIYIKPHTEAHWRMFGPLHQGGCIKIPSEQCPRLLRAWWIRNVEVPFMETVSPDNRPRAREGKNDRFRDFALNQMPTKVPYWSHNWELHFPAEFVPDPDAPKLTFAEAIERLGSAGWGREATVEATERLGSAGRGREATVPNEVIVERLRRGLPLPESPRAVTELPDSPRTGADLPQ